MSRTAKAMVTQMGMSKKLGQVAWTSSGGPSFLGQSMGQPSDCSGDTADEIDAEVKALVERAYRCASYSVAACAVVYRQACVPAVFGKSTCNGVHCHMSASLCRYSLESAVACDIFQTRALGVSKKI